MITTDVATVRDVRAVPMWIKHLAFAAAIVALWELSALFVDPIVWPPLHSVAIAFVDLLLNGSLIAALSQSLVLLFFGLTAALVTGLIIGIFIGRNPLADRMIVPFLGALYAMPTIALIPLMLVWFGFGLPGRIVVVWLVAFFPMVVAVHAGVKDAPKDLIEVAGSFGVRGEFALLHMVILPSALPMILNGLRLSIGRGIVGMVIAEVYLRLGGIGGLISQYGAVFRTDYVIAAIISLPALSLLLASLVDSMERRVHHWRR